MTPFQQQCRDIIVRLNDAEFNSWFNPSEVMAFCQVESIFKPHAYRFEHRLNEASYGLMQVLASTARSVGFVGNPADMYDPEISIRVGMKVARLYWDQLAKHFSRDPTLEEWCDSYNRGVGGVERIVDPVGEPDDAYTNVWIKAQEFWAPLVD